MTSHPSAVRRARCSPHDTGRPTQLRKARHMDSTSWDQRYASVEHPCGSAPARALMSRYAALRPGRAIDLACGDGRNARYLAESGWAGRSGGFLTGGDRSGKWRGRQRKHLLHSRRRQKLAICEARGFGGDQLPASTDRRTHAVITTAGTWLRPGGHLLYLGHALENFVYGIGGPDRSRDSARRRRSGASKPRHARRRTGAPDQTTRPIARPSTSSFTPNHGIPTKLCQPRVPPRETPTSTITESDMNCHDS